MKPFIKRYPILLLILIFFMACSPCAVTEMLFGSSESPQIGSTAPDITLSTLSGETYTLTEMQDKFVILNFWATWCQPCREELPYLQNLYEDYGNKDLILLTITSEDEQTVREFLEEEGYTFPVLIDKHNQAVRSYRVNAYPTTYFIQHDNIVHSIQVGSFDPAGLRKAVKKLMSYPVETD